VARYAVHSPGPTCPAIHTLIEVWPMKISSKDNMLVSHTVPPLTKVVAYRRLAGLKHGSGYTDLPTQVRSVVSPVPTGYSTGGKVSGRG
jgi:hypothetical protein